MSIEHDIKLQISKINEYSLVMKRMAKIDMFMDGLRRKIRLRPMVETLSDIDEKILFSSEYDEEVLAFLRGMVEMYYILR
jgi:hypothetical protein